MERIFTPLKNFSFYDFKVLKNSAAVRVGKHNVWKSLKKSHVLLNCERSEERNLIGQKFIENAKMVNFASF